MKDMTESKYSSYQGKVRLQGKEAKEGVAVGWRSVPVRSRAMESLSVQRWRRPTLEFAWSTNPRKQFAKKSQIKRKGGQRGGSVRVGDQCLSDLGQWSHYLPGVGGDPPGRYPDLQTQKGIWPKKSVYEENQQQGRLALGFEKSIS